MKAEASPRQWAFVLSIVLILFSIYGFTTPRTVTLEDDGLFIMASLDAGVAHPPGYPLFTLLGHLFSYLPLDSPAFRIHLLSGLLGAAACAVLYLNLNLAGVPSWFSFISALAYGVSEHFWSQSIIAEVYGLNALLCFSVLLFCLRFLKIPGNPIRELGVAALCFGLGLANHWPLVVLVFPAFALLLLPKWRFILKWIPILFAIALGSAGLLYLWMVWRSLQPGLTGFYGPINSLKEFWFYISRQGYAGVDVSPSADMSDRFGFIQHFAGEALMQISPAGAVFAVFGIFWLIRKQTYGILAATVWIFLAHSIGLIFLLGFDYEFLNLAVFRPYPLVSYGMLAFWMGCGFCLAWDKIRPWVKDGKPVFKLIPLFGLLIPIFLLQKNLNANDRRHDHFAENNARMILGGLEPDAVLFVYGDSETGPLGYFHFAEGVRPDIKLLSMQGLVYPNRILSPLISEGRKKAVIESFLRDTQKPVYFMTSENDFPNTFGNIHFGFYKKMNRRGNSSSIQLRFDKGVENYFKTLVEGPKPNDRWNRHRHNKLMHQFGDFLGYTLLSEDPKLNNRAGGLVKAMENQYYGLTGMAEILIQHGNSNHLKTAHEWLAKADSLMDETLSKERLGRHHYLRGFLAYRIGNREQAIKQFRSSLKVYKHPENPSRNALQRLNVKASEGGDSS